MPTVGAGVYETRVRDDAGAFRTMYAAKFPEAVCVLHAFQEKTRATSRRDLKARAQLMRVLQKTVQDWGLSQKAAAVRLGLTQPRLNDLLRGKIDKFSLDALFYLVERVGLKVSIALRKAA